MNDELKTIKEKTKSLSYIGPPAGVLKLAGGRKDTRVCVAIIVQLLSLPLDTSTMLLNFFSFSPVCLYGTAENVGKRKSDRTKSLFQDSRAKDNLSQVEKILSFALIICET